LRKAFGQPFIVLLVAIGLFAIPQVNPVVAAGNVYITPALTAALPVGSTFSVQVKVGGIDQFNGWEIQIVSDPTVISATSISTAGNIFVANTTGGISFELRNCVNGSGTGCCLTSCAPLDGPGIADSAYGYTKSVSGSGLLFTVTFKVVSDKPYSPIIIQNDQFSNGGSSGVIHTTTSGVYQSVGSISVSTFFTDGNLNALQLDNKSNPTVSVVLARNIVRSTNPGQILAWVRVNNTGQSEFQSLSLNDVLPVDWQVSPAWMPSAGSIHVYYENTTSLANNPEITDSSTITVSGRNPEIISLNIPSFSSTGIGHSLLPGQSILVVAKLGYGLDHTAQSFASYPRNYSETATAVAWTLQVYTGNGVSANSSAFFVANVKVAGDPASASGIDGLVGGNGGDNHVIDVIKYAIA
jgi:hypothetical protein